MQNFAPIALFVYNRPDHTRRTLNALQKNNLAEDSRLFIFSDGARNSGEDENVKAVRDLAHSITGFKSVEVIERERNYGLANSVIEGVSRLSKEYGRTIVLEDDVLTSPYTLQYFNDTLNKYNDVEKVMHVTAYMYPIPDANLPQTFFLRIASSQAWATWDRAWKNFEPDIDKIIARFDEQSKYQFELEGGMNFWKHVMEFKHGRNNSWAIRWYSSVFLNKGLSVNPALSLIENIGHDGSGVHSGVSTIYEGAINNFRITEFPDQLEEYKPGYKAVRHFLKHRKGSYWQRGVRYLNHVFTKLKRM
ncbi:MAG: glycosyltransferase [Candidatus Pedobacter colombiensis]|uniref:Glycosyltransferase n=1 Tax=Candidatus Pedobacter colombiensis TaxID=3121371 RepID=A0AAJ5W989_9SPHI|nr:glycosyltransferase [Pedobacter sp.]WEK19603.1 MAG: glycosyltransferase [Pedobacter sp.]